MDVSGVITDMPGVMQLYSLIINLTEKSKCQQVWRVIARKQVGRPIVGLLYAHRAFRFTENLPFRYSAAHNVFNKREIFS